jgi:hypothetical protein
LQPNTHAVGLIGAIAAAGALPLGAGEAFAHGLGERYDLPLPLWLYVVGAAGAVAASFVFLIAFRRAPRPASRRARVLARGRIPALLVHSLQAFSVGLFVLIVAAGLVGSQNPFKNIAPVSVWVLWWVGLSFVCAFVGNIWPVINPMAVMVEWASALLGHPGLRPPRCTYPSWLGVWPACGAFLMFAWVELVAPGRDVPRNVALAVMLYASLTWIGCWLFGTRVWLRRGEAFSIAFALLGRFAPLCITSGRHRWAWRLRPYAVGLLSDHPVHRSLIAFALLMLATVTVDGLMETPLWASTLERAAGSRGEDAGRAMLLSSLLLCIAPVLFALSYFGVVATMSICVARAGTAQRSLNELAGCFVLTLVPIAIAYNVAHYLSFLLLAGQWIIPLASDPLGLGWDLFGTTLYRINIGIIDARSVWFVAVGAIVIGHVLATWLAHRTALAVFADPAIALRSQLPMIVLMISYTMTSLWILAQPIVEG